MVHVALKNISKVYPNGVRAVQPTSFDIDKGEFIVLVGPSGCGKSTLLRMIAGLEEITEGELSIAGRVVNHVDPAERDIAMVFQNYALYPHMTVYNNMAYGLRNRGMAKADIDAAVSTAATMLNLTEYLARRPSQLSGGQRQRVAMGRAIVRNPALFLFDEPLSNLDAKLRGQMRIEIKALQRRLGVTSVYVTHDQVEAMTMADRIIVLNGGRIEQIGTPAEVYHQPASTFVASFMGAPPMNLLPAHYNGNGRVHLSDAVHIEAPLTADYSGQIKLGVRPENVGIVDPSHPDALRFDLEFVEELGAGRLLHGKLGDSGLIVHIPHTDAIPCGEVYVGLPKSALVMFNHETGMRL
ncbi:sn-glycerol-3-phosphate ABC transporter ATP-binding protein UgpC [Hoeflea sp.]|uniref:sn-glycerol-3-phosphate ABC transporter ATP-binding protein UgpC n=1 Tax=Hoeflea sp. TaxID=1940281 RepID=UPI0019A699C0|nr:sn-glycerol-3-phosphate ABC transporter ATP-binding protein UgpC [Hoeflea sp.]MBC7282798.1 sn-glycerol-3-phosphate ABC transporter ATP-binding protein UgpC [Hoeflea sp.]